MTPERVPARPEALDAALAVQLDRLERMTLRALQVLTGFGLVLSLVLALTTASGLGIACATISGVLLTWFVVFDRWLARRPATPTMRLVNILIESSGPWMFLALIAKGEGPMYALSSWVPPLTFCILIVVYTARLRPRACLVLGGASAILYAAIYVFYFRPHLPTEPMLLTRPMTQVSRMLLLLFAGILGALVARGVRQAFARAESQVRQQDLFGKYRLVRKIASGGMGMVFEAVYCPEGGFERRVAVKRIHPHLAADEKFVGAFRDEAELSARLAHPCIVQVFDFGRIGDSFFLAMEHVDGMTLNALVYRVNRRKKKLSAATVGHVLRSVLGALAYAHEGARGADGRPLRVVHRDLCPPNVLVSRNGEVKLTDFGIARSLSDAGVSMTKSITGHVGYMAPEQARAAPFDVRADLFPVGVMAWELFTLRPCFRKDNEAASLNALLYDDVPPVSLVRDDVDPRWSIWIERAMARDPAARYASAADMLSALDVIPESRAPEAVDELARLVEELSRHDERDDPFEEATQNVSGDGDRDPTTLISS